MYFVYLLFKRTESLCWREITVTQVNNIIFPRIDRPIQVPSFTVILFVMNITETLLCTGEGSQGSYRESCSVSLRLPDRGALSMGESKRVIIRKAWPWTIVSNVFGECHAPCTQKTYFVDFEKE